MTKGHFLSFFCRICVQSRHGKPCHHTDTCKRCPGWWPLDEYGEYTWGWGCPTMQYPLQFTLGSLLWCSCDFVPVLKGILQRYSDIGMTGRYLGGSKFALLFFFLVGIFGKHIGCLILVLIYGVFKTIWRLVLREYTSHVVMPSTTKHWTF